MRRTRIFRWLAGLLAIAPFPGVAAAQQGIDVRAMTDALMQRMALRRGEGVLIVGVPGAWDAFVATLRERIRSAGARDLGVLATQGSPPAAWETDFTRAARALDRAGLVAHFAPVDIAIMMPGATTSDVAYAAMQDVLRAGRGRTIHFHWSGAYALDGRPLEITPAMSRVYERVVLHTDYRQLAAVQRRFEQAARNADIRVTTSAGTDLRFRIGDRPVTKQDGDASAARMELARNLIDREIELPAGAIRVAPIEESVSGTIAFPPGMWGGERAEGLVMTFAAGKLTTFETRTGRAGVERELAH